MEKAPVVNVGILTEKAVAFQLNGDFICAQTSHDLTGEQHVLWVDGKIGFNSKLYEELFFQPMEPDASFDLKAVTIGVNFHWERREDQRFRGALFLRASKDGIVTINQIDVEEYLTSVISSEMSAMASPELLRAHAVISRSWLLAQIEKNIKINKAEQKYQTSFLDNEQLIRWYDREDHTLFDVCADDHCQRYQGITRASTPAVSEAIRITRGEILMDNKDICDARFSKCCGGVTEKFENCWEPVPHSYLTDLRDSKEAGFPDLRIETEADRWIRTSPEAFCNTRDKEILSQVLNNYDQETMDFYRWKVEYTQEQLAELIHRKTGINFGEILDLTPLERGTSGRIIRLKITGTRKTFTIGKELEIRRTLSETHLYSSAFVVDKDGEENGIPRRFILTGAGWGHGVGLCQIGAAVMGSEGYTYQQILNHYFPGAELVRRY